jgi:hypothetical protein
MNFDNMNLTMNSGTLYINDGPLMNVDSASMLSTTYEDIGSERLSFNVNAEFSADLSYVNYDLFDKLRRVQEPHKFKIEANIPIMIQAKWHKKRRINKKWLKRYGMKPDVVKVEMDADSLEYTPGEIIGTTDTGIIGSYNSFDFKTQEIRYVFREDQLRKNRKVEFV